MTEAKKPAPKRKRKKASPKKRLEKEIGKLWSQNVRKLYKGQCATCTKPGTAAHHFFGRQAYPGLKYDLDNGVWLCFSCHFRKVHDQGDTEPARDALIKRIGKKGFEDLKKRRLEVRQYRTPDLQTLKDELIIKLESLQ